MRDREPGANEQTSPDCVRRRLVLGMSFAMTGCVPPYGPERIEPGPPAPRRIATLDVEGRVDVLQAGRSSAGRDGMALFGGDEVRTFGSSYAQIRFLDGDQVWLDFDTRVRVGSIFTFFGRVFASVSGVFQVDSEFVAASSESTEYTVTIGRGGRNAFSVAVRTGAVHCAPRRGRWRGVRLVSGQRLTGQGDATPALDRLDNREMQSEFGWVPALRRIPGTLRPLPPRPEGYTQPVPRTPAPVTKPSEPVLR